MPEADQNFMCLLILGIAAQFQRLRNDFAEILLAVFLLADIFHALPADHIRAVNTVLVAFSRAHQAVGCHQNTPRQIVELLLLILPRTAEIPDQVRIFFQALVAMAGQHFPMRINIDALALRLLQKHFQVLQIMPGNHDKRTFFHVNINGMRRRIAVNLGVCLVQLLHNGNRHLACAHRQANQLLYRQGIIRNCLQCLDIEIVHLVTVIPQLPRLMPVGTDALQAIQHRLPQGADIGI